MPSEPFFLPRVILPTIHLPAQKRHCQTFIFFILLIYCISSASHKKCQAPIFFYHFPVLTPSSHSPFSILILSLHNTLSFYTSHQMSALFLSLNNPLQWKTMPWCCCVPVPFSSREEKNRCSSISCLTLATLELEPQQVRVAFVLPLLCFLSSSAFILFVCLEFTAQIYIIGLFSLVS